MRSLASSIADGELADKILILLSPPIQPNHNYKRKVKHLQKKY